MLDIDNWVWDRSTYWWDRLNRAFHTLYEIPAISITDRLARKAGVCRILKGKLEIVLYEHYIKNEGEKYDQTIGHELAHAHNWCHHHRMSHGYIWQEAMNKIGLPALRCHNYETPRDLNFTCLCGSLISIGPTVLKQIQAGRIRICLKCKRKVGLINGKVYSYS